MAPYSSYYWRRSWIIKNSSILSRLYFSDGGSLAHFTPKHRTPGTVIIPAEGPSKTESIIKRNKTCQAERYVGVRIAPDGQMNTEYQYRLKQAKDLGQKIAQAHLTRSEATLTFQSRWMSIIGFYLPITCFTKKQCKQLQIPIYIKRSFRNLATIDISH